MADARPDRRRGLTSHRAIGAAQLLLVVAAGALWMASRAPWVVIRSFDELGPVKVTTLSGASWSTALAPLALLMLAAAVAALAVRGWPLRVLAVLLAVASLAAGYLGVSLWVIPDVAMRGADLAGVPVVTLVGSSRHYWGAAAAVLAAICALIGALVLMRSASHAGSARDSAAKYASPAARRSRARGADADVGSAQTNLETEPEISERMMWDALDEGRDPTDRPRGADTEGR
nr:TIGR02234 family membrane protein [Mycobacterium spongiae]